MVIEMARATNFDLTEAPLLHIIRQRSFSFHQGPDQLFENLIRCDRHIYFSARITVALRSRLHATLHREVPVYLQKTESEFTGETLTESLTQSGPRHAVCVRRERERE